MQTFEGGSPTFEAVDGSGIVVAAKLISGNVIAPRSGDGGFGSVGDVLLGVNSARGTFRWGAVSDDCAAGNAPGCFAQHHDEPAFRALQVASHPS